MSLFSGTPIILDCFADATNYDLETSTVKFDHFCPWVGNAVVCVYFDWVLYCLNQLRAARRFSHISNYTTGRLESQVFCSFRGLHILFMHIVAGYAVFACILLWLENWGFNQ